MPRFTRATVANTDGKMHTPCVSVAEGTKKKKGSNLQGACVTIFFDKKWGKKKTKASNHCVQYSDTELRFCLQLPRIASLEVTQR